MYCPLVREADNPDFDAQVLSSGENQCYMLRREEIGEYNAHTSSRGGCFCASPTASRESYPTELYIFRSTDGRFWQSPQKPKLRNYARRVR